MCVIIVKEKNGVLPQKEALENCFTRNGDGAGFMYVESGKVVIDKGYTTFKQFYRHYQRLCRKFNNFENKNLVMHMRIATSGGVKRENTHPFPLEDNYKDMMKLYYRTDIGIAHNGVITATKPSKEQEDKKINDTMVFIKGYLYNIYEDWPECFNNVAFNAGIVAMTYSKFAVLNKNDELTLIGEFTEHEGVKYSNSSYIKYEVPKTSETTKYNNRKYDGYDQYEYDYGYDYDYDRYDYDKYDKYGNYDDDLYEDYPEIVLEDCDLVAMSFEGDYKRIETLRTEQDSVFVFNTETLILKEFSKTGKVLQQYRQVYVYDSSTQTVY